MMIVMMDGTNLLDLRAILLGLGCRDEVVLKMRVGAMVLVHYKMRVDGEMMMEHLKTAVDGEMMLTWELILSSGPIMFVRGSRGREGLRGRKRVRMCLRAFSRCGRVVFGPWGVILPYSLFCLFCPAGFTDNMLSCLRVQLKVSYSPSEDKKPEFISFQMLALVLIFLIMFYFGRPVSTAQNPYFLHQSLTFVYNVKAEIFFHEV
jgi:hypothetical protein